MNKKSWFKKPAAMESSCGRAKKVCWLDTDCQVFGDISGIFDLTVPNKIGMVEDRPWTKRRGEYGTWYNSGVVLFEDRPTILKAWKEMCITQGWHGDQETLYAMMGGDEILKMSIIEPLPHKYNTLRLDYLDKIAVKNPLIVHHTGEKGNKVIRSKLIMFSKVLFGVILAMGLTGYVYYTASENKIAGLNAQLQTQAGVITAFETRQAEQVSTIEALQGNLQRTTEALQTQNARNQEIEGEMQRYLNIFARHDLSKLAAQSSGLIQTRINKGTKDVFDTIENDSVVIDTIDD